MRDADVARFLRPGPDQDRLVSQMARGHARARHGAELGNPSADRYQELVRAHLGRAPYIYAAESPGGHRAYLIADAETNRVAWVAPHTPKRATFFRPRDGVAEFIDRKRLLYGADRWRRVDAGHLRAAPSRTTARGITSVQRVVDRSAATRVP